MRATCGVIKFKLYYSGGLSVERWEGDYINQKADPDVVSPMRGKTLNLCKAKMMNFGNYFS